MSANADNSAVARNALTSYAGWAVNLAIGLVVTPILLRGLGAQGFGAWTVAIAVTGYVALVELGLGVATARHLASSLAVGDTTGASAVAASARAAYLMLAGVGSIVLGTLVMLPGVLPTITSTSSDGVRITILVLGLGNLLQLMVTIYPVVAVGAGRVDLGMRVGIASRVVIAVAQVVVVQLSGSLIQLALVTGVGAIGSTLAIRAVVLRHFRDIDVRFANARREIARRLLSSGWRNAAIVATFAVAFQSDVLVIAAILGPISVAAYGIAVRASMTVFALSTRATDVLVPTFAHTTKVDDKQRTLNALRESVFLARAILIPALITLIAFGEPLLRLWLGEVPTGANSVLILLVLGTAIAAPGYSAYVLLTGMNRLTYLLVGSSIAAAANLGISVLLTWQFGIIGPALGSLVAFAIWDLAFLPRYVGALLEIPWVPLSLAGLSSLLVPSLAAASSAAVCVAGFGWTTPRASLLGGAVVISVYLTVLWATLGSGRRSRYRNLLVGATARGGATK